MFFLSDSAVSEQWRSVTGERLRSIPRPVAKIRPRLATAVYDSQTPQLSLRSLFGESRSKNESTARCIRCGMERKFAGEGKEGAMGQVAGLEAAGEQGGGGGSSLTVGGYGHQGSRTQETKAR